MPLRAESPPLTSPYQGTGPRRAHVDLGDTEQALQPPGQSAGPLLALEERPIGENVSRGYDAAMLVMFAPALDRRLGSSPVLCFDDHGITISRGTISTAFTPA
jgi:hypothetical protein